MVHLFFAFARIFFSFTKWQGYIRNSLQERTENNFFHDWRLERTCYCQRCGSTSFLIASSSTTRRNFCLNFFCKKNFTDMSKFNGLCYCIVILKTIWHRKDLSVSVSRIQIRGVSKAKRASAWSLVILCLSLDTNFSNHSA